MAAGTACFGRVLRFSVLWSENVAGTAVNSAWWAASYILPVIMIFGQVTLLLIHWRRLKVDLDIAGVGFNHKLKGQLKKKAMIGPWIAFLAFTIVEMAVFLTSVTSEYQSLLVNVVNTALVGAIILLEGWWLYSNGLKITALIEEQAVDQKGVAPLNTSGRTDPTRMNLLVGRMSKLFLACGPIILVAGLVNIGNPSQTPTMFLVRSVLFRIVEVVVLVTVLSVYKLPYDALQDALRRMDERAMLNYDPPVITRQRRLSIRVATLNMPRRGSDTGGAGRISPKGPVSPRRPSPTLSIRKNNSPPPRRLSLRPVVEQSSSTDLEPPQVPGVALSST